MRDFAKGLIAATAMAAVLGAPSFAQARDLGEPTATLANGAPYSFADLIENVAPAVVSLTVEANVRVNPSLDDFGVDPEDVPEFFFDDQRPGSSGSGFFVSDDGYIVTNHHVVDEAREVTVNLADGTAIQAQIVGSDPASDLAVLKVTRDEPFPFVSFAEDTNIRVGDWVVALGNPFNLGASASAGIVSAVDRDVVNRNGGQYTPFIQIDAPINPGNSGGPSFDLQGQVIGVNSQIITRSGGSNGVGFAISADVAADIVDQLIEEGEVRRGWLGVWLQSVDEDFAEGFGLPSAEGAIVQRVIEDSPAEAGGFRDGDVIIAIDGRNVTDQLQATRVVGGLRAGQDAEFTVVRGGKSQTLTVTIGERETEETEDRPARSADRTELANMLGLNVREATQDELDMLNLDLTAPAVAVTRVYPGGPAAGRGIQRGSVILEVNATPVSTESELYDELNMIVEDNRAVAILTVIDRNGQRFVPVRLNITEE